MKTTPKILLIPNSINAKLDRDLTLGMVIHLAANIPIYALPIGAAFDVIDSHKWSYPWDKLFDPIGV